MRLQWKEPDGYRVQHFPLFASVVLAYFSVDGFLSHGTTERVINAPEWLKHDTYDFFGKVAEADVPAWQKQAHDLPLMQQMVRAALKDRCKLQVHIEKKDSQVFGLVIGKRAPALSAADPTLPDPPYTVRLATGGKMIPYRSKQDPTVTYVDVSMAEFAANLSNSASRPVVDKTGLAGRYTFRLTLRDNAEEGAGVPEMASPWDIDKLGFRLVPITAPLEVLVIDHIEKPTEN